MSPTLSPRQLPWRAVGLMKTFRNVTMTNRRDLPHDLPTRPGLAPAGRAEPVAMAGDVAADVALADWLLLFEAVMDRLRRMAVAADGLEADRLATLPSQVLDCVTALEQLALTLAHERERDSQRERRADSTQRLKRR